MESFVYSVWFRDASASTDDQDREWVACIGIQAKTARQAQEWGDTLARQRCESLPAEVFVSSSVEPERELGNQDLSSLLRINAGERAPDETLGW